MSWGLRVALIVLRSRRGRRLLLGLAVGLAGALVVAIMFMTSAVAAVFGMCKDTAEELSEASAGSPTYVSSEPSEAAFADIPADYLEAYRAAAEEYGMDWAILAAVGKQETNHGRDIAGCATSEAGARGPMQFMPSTWASEGVDGDGDGTKDPCNVEDAVHAAAGYLASLGAPEDYHGALCAYYGACGDADADYANEVLGQAEEYREAGESTGQGGAREPGSTPALVPPLVSPAHAREEGGSGGGAGVATPVDAEYMDGYEDDWGEGRPGFAGGFHDGTDIGAPLGAPIRAMVGGVVVEESNSDEDMYQEVGGYNVVVEATESVGPVEEGDWIQYAHMDSEPGVRPGDRVSAGEVIGEVGDTGYGPAVTRGELEPHVHIGWYDPSGERAEHPTGAMNPYPLLQWVQDHAGPGASGSAGPSEAVPTATPPSSGAGRGLPEYCTPFRLAGLVEVVSNGVSNLGSSGGGEIGGGPQRGQDLVRAAQAYLGAPYILGGLDPAACNPDSVDCSCLVYLAANDIGIPGAEDLPDDPQAYLQLGEPVEGPPQAGDVIIYDQSGILASVPGGHIAIATGNGNEVIHAIPPETTYSPDYRDQGPVNGIRRIV